MVNDTQTETEDYRETSLDAIAGNYRSYTDKYFLRTRQILEAEGINPIVRYQVFVRQDIESLRGVDEAVSFIQSVAGDKVRVYASKNGESYTAKDPLIKLEGRVQDLVELETVYLGIVSGSLTGELDFEEMREKARAIVNAAEGKPVYYFGARHFHPGLDERISRICQEEGFAGSSTDIGAKAWNSKGIGTIPHALILSYAAHMHSQGLTGNPTVKAAKAFDKHIDKEVPRIVLIDTFNREIYDSVLTARNIPDLAGIRIDTCGENYSEGIDGEDLPYLPGIDPKYVGGKGVTINSVWVLRKALNSLGFDNLKITVSSGFNEEKTKAFVQADKLYQERYGKPLFDSIGTGSLANPIMATSDIVSYYNEDKGQWIPLSKKGRGETTTKFLEEVK